MKSIAGRPALTRRVAAVMVACSTAACSVTSPDLPRGAAAYELIPAASNARPADYIVGPLDVISVTVFQEPDLTFRELQVDASGNISFPLIGEVRAAGQTPRALSTEIASRLGQNYLRNPQVNVSIASSVSQRVIVDGNVNEPGVFDISGSATLVEAIARAQSTTRTAKLNEVVIFRIVNGQRVGAVFDLGAIRAGAAPDPRLLGGDTVVVGFDAVKGGFRDFLSASPFLTVFTRF